MNGYDLKGLATQWLDRSAHRLLDEGLAVARRHSHRYARGPHVILAATEHGLLDEPLGRAGLEREELLAWIAPIARSASARWAASGEPTFDEAFLRRLEVHARRSGRVLGAADILALVLREGVGLTATEIGSCHFDRDALVADPGANGDGSATPPAGPRGAAPVDASSAAAVLAAFTVDLQHQSRAQRELYGEPVPEVGRVAGILGRMSRPNALLVGPPGVGKTAIVESLAASIAAGNAPEWLRDQSIHAVSCPALVARAERRDVVETVQRVIDAAIVRGDVLLFFDDLHALADPAIGGTGNLAGLFGPYLARRGFRMIAAADTSGFETLLRPSAGLLRRFDVVKVEEPREERVLAMLERHETSFTEHYDLAVEPEALGGIVRNGERFLPERRFPDKAVSLLDAAMQRARELDRKRLDLGIVLDVVAEESGIPLGRISEMELTRLEGLQRYLDERIYDQAGATRSAARAIQGMRLGLHDPTRTGAAFLLVGPPGTGKTELAKALADYVMGSEKFLVRFNMSEFQTPESYQRLLGPPPGYVGYEAGGELTNALMRNPYSVVLFDEVEKGASGVFDVLLQVLSDGHLTDNHGRVVDCKNSVFLMTSNALTDVDGWLEEQIRDALTRHHDPRRGAGPTFRHEFVDRLEILPFRALSADTLRRILRREVGRVLDRFNANVLVPGTVSIDDAAMDWLVGRIDATSTGARSVHRLVARAVTQLLTESAVDGGIRGDATYELTVAQGSTGLTLNRKEESQS